MEVPRVPDTQRGGGGRGRWLDHGRLSEILRVLWQRTLGISQSGGKDLVDCKTYSYEGRHGFEVPKGYSMMRLGVAYLLGILGTCKGVPKNW